MPQRLFICIFQHVKAVGLLTGAELNILIDKTYSKLQDLKDGRDTSSLSTRLRRFEYLNRKYKQAGPLFMNFHGLKLEIHCLYSKYSFSSSTTKTPSSGPVRTTY